MTLDAARIGLPVLLTAISAGAWVLTWRLGDSAWGPWFHGHALLTGGPTHHVSAAAAGGMFVMGWIVMTTAMMLPTTLPLVAMFQRLTSVRADRVRLMTSLVAGYLSSWALCGVVVFLVSWALQSFVPALVIGHDSYTGAGLFALAGAFQFSKLKYQCLDKCRSPLSFLTSRWRGTQHSRQSFRLGLEHGLFCVGCCWALMLLMFAFGAVSVTWMLALAGVMALEKNMPWGRRLSTPLGVVLVLGGIALLVS
jgi:predicted metal-binding membrane protein